MTKNWRKTGYLIPDEIDPEENICVCVPVPKDWGHINAFLGQMTELAKWLTWEKDGTDSAVRTARRWMEITECVIEEINCIMSTGCGCGCDDREPIGQRINEDGFLEVTYDGITWEEQRAGDTRFSNPILPPTAGADGAIKRCQAANSVTTGLEQKQAEDHAKLVAGATFADFVAGMVGFLVGVGVITGGISAVLAVITTAIAALLANVSAAIFDGWFTPATWDELLCIVYCNTLDDGSYTEQNWQDIRAQVASEIGGDAGNWIAQHILGLGTVGLTNLARQQLPGTRTCDLCECADEAWCFTWDFTDDDDDWSFTAAGFGTYTPTVGFTGQPYGTGGGVSRLERTFADSMVTSIQVVHTASGYTGFQKLLRLNLNADPDQDHNLSGLMNGTDILSQYNQANFVAFEIDRITLFWDGAASSAMTIKSVTVRGVGVNPFGVDNCI